MSKKTTASVAGFFQALLNVLGSTIKTLALTAVVGCLMFLAIITGFVTILVNILR